MGNNGIKPLTVWLEDNRSTPSPTAVPNCVFDVTTMALGSFWRHVCICSNQFQVSLDARGCTPLVRREAHTGMGITRGLKSELWRRILVEKHHDSKPTTSEIALRFCDVMSNISSHRTRQASYFHFTDVGPFSHLLPLASLWRRLDEGIMTVKCSTFA